MEILFAVLRNIGAAVALAFGLITVVNPRLVARVFFFTLENDRSRSELRVIGGFFVGMAAWAIITQNTAAFQTVGVAWLTAASVRIMSVFVDKVRLRGGVLYLLLLEIVMSGFLLL